MIYYRYILFRVTTAHQLESSDKASTVCIPKEDIYATVGRKKGIIRQSVEELDFDPYSQG